MIQYDFRQDRARVVEIKHQDVGASQLLVPIRAKIFGAGVLVSNSGELSSHRVLDIGDVHAPVNCLKTGTVEDFRVERRRRRGPEETYPGDQDDALSGQPSGLPVRKRTCYFVEQSNVSSHRAGVGRTCEARRRAVIRRARSAPLV